MRTPTWSRGCGLALGVTLMAGCAGAGSTSPTPDPAVAAPTPCSSPAAETPATPTHSWTWEGVSVPTPLVGSIAVDPEDERVLYAYGGQVGLFVSHDAGARWGGALSAVVAQGSLAFVPGNSCTVFVGFNRDLMRSDNRGHNWRSVHTFPDFISSVYVSRDARRILVGPSVNPRNSGSPEGIWVSTDLGTTWTHSALPTVSRGLIPRGLVEDLSGVFYAGTEIYDHPQPYRPPYFRSRDLGATWENVTGTLPWHVVQNQAHPAELKVYALTEGAGLYVTEDQGTSWRRLGRSYFSLALLIDPRSPHVLYGGEHTFGGRPGGAYVSTDEGMSFRPIGLEGMVVGSLAFNGSGTRLYASTYGTGLFRATIPQRP